MKKTIRVHRQSSGFCSPSQATKQPGKNPEVQTLPVWAEDILVHLRKPAFAPTLPEVMVGKRIYRMLQALSRECQVSTSDLLLAAIWRGVKESDLVPFPHCYLIPYILEVSKHIQAKRFQLSVKGGAQ